MSESKKGPVRENGATTKGVNKGLADNITQPKNPVNLQTAFQTLINEISGLEYGTISLEVHIRSGQPSRYTISKQASFLIDGEWREPWSKKK